MSDAEERRDSGDLLQEEVQMSTKRSLSLATRPLGDLSPHAASQLHSYLLQLVDPLLHAADGGQRAECLGVEAPEGVLPADLEQRAGRIIRQGNQNKNVEIYRYVTKGTFDGS